MTKIASNKPRIKKILSVIATVITALFCIATALILIKVVVSKVSGKPVSFFGTSFAIVVTPSMEPEIMTGDLIVFHTVSYDDIKVGDNIVFIADENFKDSTGSSLNGSMIVHKVKEITENGIITKGVNNAVQDDGYREEGEVLGICTYNSSALGAIFTFLCKYGIIIILILIAVPIIVKLVLKIISYGKEAKEESLAQGIGEEDPFKAESQDCGKIEESPQDNEIEAQDSEKKDDE